MDSIVKNDDANMHEFFFSLAAVIRVHFVQMKAETLATKITLAKLESFFIILGDFAVRCVFQRNENKVFIWIWFHKADFLPRLLSTFGAYFMS